MRETQHSVVAAEVLGLVKNSTQPTENPGKSAGLESRVQMN
jgi:hypothetical protein